MLFTYPDIPIDLSRLNLFRFFDADGCLVGGLNDIKQRWVTTGAIFAWFESYTDIVIAHIQGDGRESDLGSVYLFDTKRRRW